MYFSANNKAFYDVSLKNAFIQSNAWPEDAILLSDDEISKYVSTNPPIGYQLDSDSNGRPCFSKVGNATYEQAKKSVDELREIEYTKKVRSYIEEAEIKKHMGDHDEYTRLMDLAVLERKKIQAEHPWPTPPEV